VDFDFGSPAEDAHGHYSAVIPKNNVDVRKPVGYREWLINGSPISLEDIIVDSEQTLFTKGIQVGPVLTASGPSHTPQFARSTDWIAPKILLNLRRPSDLEFSLDRSSARLTSPVLMDSIWGEIAKKLKACMFNTDHPSAADTAALLGTCAVFGGVPDSGLAAVIEKNDAPLLVLVSGGGLAWRFAREFADGDEFCEAPYELGYAINQQPREIGDQLSFAGWDGQDMLFPSEGCTLGTPPYLSAVLRFGEDALT
jgi:hypothetical protein